MGGRGERVSTSPGRHRRAERRPSLGRRSAEVTPWPRARSLLCTCRKRGCEESSGKVLISLGALKQPYHILEHVCQPHRGATITSTSHSRCPSQENTVDAHVCACVYVCVCTYVRIHIYFLDPRGKKPRPLVMQTHRVGADFTPVRSAPHCTQAEGV